MLLVPTYLAPSAIHGTGLFAAEPIAKGTKIWEFLPGLDVEIEVAHLEHPIPAIRAYLRRYTYPHPTREGFVVLDGDNGRFMNHDNAPNTDFTIPEVGYARTDIAAGDELTTDYNEFAPGFIFE